MKIAAYPFMKRPESYYYEFFSEGPNGRIKKVVEYFRLHDPEAEVYNLAFGDWDEEERRINDLSVSNNADRDKVLATVGATVTDFMEVHPQSIVIAAGSTPSRTRLYQMGIVKVLDEINQDFEIQGYIDNSWKSFEKGVNYSAFLLKAR
jgi:hypothetical protein